MRKIELTQRDLRLFEKLSSYGILTTKQLCQLIFPRIDTSVALRRLRLLKSKGYLSTHNGLGRGLLVWTVTKKALSRLGSDLEGVAVNRHTLEHDIMVSQLRMRLEINGVGEHWKNGFLLRQKSQERDSGKAKQIPDSIFAIQAPKGPRVMALELETVSKSKRRYRQILANYAFKSGLHYIWYVVRSEALGKFLTSIPFRLEGEEFPIVVYSLLDDVLSESRPITLVGADRRFVLLSGGDQTPDQPQGSPENPRTESDSPSA